ncbi:hypothetical protein ORV05_34635 [Amycolatopsis cynarae]|uniref:Uncharacterized protein n=1 Tax=Amycolatopsis cynarae TaxID=2995223 RepID=A0ABY7B0V8_9PSEU|nr:hypothetical protein [Amycolatopsis sp. HUAS 11-8]WAL65936.1 hypothetical protein ORV05_34635 [Amycolatopsis sp. HUAS 11-8]
MSDRTESAGVAEAARLLDDMTQQMTPVPPVLDEGPSAEPDRPTRPRLSEVDGHVL